jgi:hypothetical protein
MTLTVRSASVTGATTASRSLTHAEMDANWAHFVSRDAEIQASLAASTGAALVGFTQSGTGAITSDTVQAALRRLTHTAQYDSTANYRTARDALTGTFGMANLEVTGTFAIGTNSPTSAIFKIGGATQLSTDQGIVVARSLTTGSSNAHGIDDNTVFSRDTFAYASFDAKAQMTGNVTIGHYAGFEEDGKMLATTVNSYYSYIVASNIDGSAVDSKYGLYIYDTAIASGSLTNQYGIYINDLTAGGTLNYAIWTNGSTASRFGGAVTVVGTITVGGGAATTPEVRVGNTSDGIALRGISGEGRILGYDTGSAGFNTVAIYTGANAAFRVDTSQNVVIANAALATNATGGFLYIPTCAGAPSGTPTSYTGRVPIVFDSTNNQLYIYDGSWLKTVALT